MGALGRVRETFTRLLLGFGVVVVGLVAVGLGAARASVPACGVTWTGRAGDGLWGAPANWSTNRVPGASSDVCVAGALVFVRQGISVHSLRVASDAQLYWEDGPSLVSVRVASDLINDGRLVFDGQNGSNFAVSAPSFDSSGYVDALGNSTISSAAFSMSGELDVSAGTMTLTNTPVQLQNGTLTAGTWGVNARGTLVLPHDISRLTNATVELTGVGASVQDEAGDNALASLSAIAPTAALDLQDQATLAVSGSLVSSGLVLDGGYGGGDELTVAGTYTELSGADTSVTDSTLTANGVTVEHGAGLDSSGAATVNGSVSNSGEVGGYPLTVNGNYTQTSDGTLNAFFGITLAVSGKATLSGALITGVHTRFPPPRGASFPAVTYATHNGTFSTHTPDFDVTTSAHALKVTYLG